MTSKTLSTDPPWQTFKLSKHSLRDLRSQSSILHLLHHRSKNQHRRSPWYRHFSTFRKQLLLLLAELDPEVSPTLASPPSQQAKVFAENLRKAEARLGFWAEVMVGKWYAAFGQLVWDTQFAVLGLALLAGLGKVVKVLGVLERMKKGAERELVGSGLGSVAERGWRSVDVAVTAAGEDEAQELREDDMGVSIDRNDDFVDDGDVRIDGVGVDIERALKLSASVDGEMSHRKKGEKTSDGDTGLSTLHATPKTSPRRKRKRAGDEIDDLFSGLL
jgi:hypothetical protein